MSASTAAEDTAIAAGVRAIAAIASVATAVILLKITKRYAETSRESVVASRETGQEMALQRGEMVKQREEMALQRMESATPALIPLNIYFGRGLNISVNFKNIGTRPARTPSFRLEHRQLEYGSDAFDVQESKEERRATFNLHTTLL